MPITVLAHTIVTEAFAPVVAGIMFSDADLPARWSFLFGVSTVA